MSTPRLRLGQLLVDAKLISEEDLQEVLALQKSLQGSSGKRLGALLVERRLINETQLTQILSHQLSVPWVSLLHIEFSRQLLNLVPHDVAERYCLVPIYVRHVRSQGDTLYVAMDDPTNEDGLKACRDHSGLPVRAMIAPPTDIRSAIRVYYGVEGAVRPPPERVEPEAPPVGSGPVTIEPTSEAAGPEVEGRPTVPDIPMYVEHKPSPEPPPAEAAPPRHPSDAPSIEIGGEAPAIEIGAPASAPVSAPASAPPSTPPPASAPQSWRGGRTPAERLRGILQPEGAPPSAHKVENIPKPRGRAPRMVGLTLLDGTKIDLPAAKKGRRREEAEEASAAAAPAAAGREPSAPSPEAAPPPRKAAPSSPEEAHGLTARDLVLALRAVANGADASEVLGNNVRWEAMFAALLSLMLKKHLIADWEFVDELKRKLL